MNVRQLLVLGLCVVAGCTRNSTPTTFDGTWSGDNEAKGPRVHRIQISKNEFPCDGKVETASESGNLVGMNVVWDKKGEQLVATFKNVGSLGKGDKPKEVAWVELSRGGLAGKVRPVFTADELSFSGFRRSGP